MTLLMVSASSAAQTSRECGADPEVVVILRRALARRRIYIIDPSLTFGSLRMTKFSGSFRMTDGVWFNPSLRI
jgi:hypothetical protein